MDDTRAIHLHVNGEHRHCDVAPRQHLVDRHVSAVDEHRIVCRSKRRHRTPPVSLVTFPYVREKVGEPNT